MPENTLPPMELEILLANGDDISLYQDDPAHISTIISSVRKGRLFSQEQLQINSITCFSTIYTKEIECMIFRFPGLEEFRPPFGLEDIQEVKEEDFQRRYEQLSTGEKVKMRDVADGEVMEGFAEVHLRSGATLYLDLWMHKRTRADQILAFTELFNPPMLPYHTADKAYGILNTQNIVRVTGHPGPKSVPPTSWYLEPREE